MAGGGRYDAVLFDLLTGLLDSWTLWNDIAGGADRGMAWRRAYLEITYGCGAYRPYEDLVREAAEAAGLEAEHPAALLDRWDELRSWPEATGVLAALKGRAKLGVVTNCSIALGRRAAKRASPEFDVVATAEEAGAYKPDPAAYRLGLEALGTDPARTLFVAGSAADVPGAAALGMPVFWHNRIGLPARGDAAPMATASSLSPLLDLV